MTVNLEIEAIKKGKMKMIKIVNYLFKVYENV